MKVSVSSLIYDEKKVDVLEVINSGADFLHLDVMDGSMTKNKTFLWEEVENINENSTIFLDCHLMINEPKNVLEKFVLAGANVVSIHFEAFKNKNDLIDCLKFLRENKVLVGLCVCTKTNVDEIEKYKDLIDLVVLMGVEIGEYGQKMNENIFEKIEYVKKNFPKLLVEVDGGVNTENIQKLKELGVDIVVCGSSFKKAQNKKEFVEFVQK